MKQGWQRKKLGDLLEVQNGYAFDSKLFSPDGKMPLIRIRDLKEGVVTETNYSGDYDEKYVVRRGDFLVGMDGEFGCYEWHGESALLNQRVCRLQNFHPSLSSRFLFYGINSHLKDIEEVTGYSTVKHLSSKQILGVDFLFPQLPEQQRIVGILDAAFDGIAHAAAAANQNLQNARALFESHLQSVFTQRGEGWERRPLAEVCAEIFAGGDVPKGNYSKTETDKYRIPIFTNGEKNKGLYGYTYTARVTEPSITISARGTIGYSEIRSESYYPAIRLIVVIPRKEILDLSFLYYAIESIEIGHSGTSIPQLTVPMVKDFSIPIPPLAAQQKIAVQLDALREQTQQLESLYRRKLAALAELKKSLLHQAFSGAL